MTGKDNVHYRLLVVASVTVPPINTGTSKVILEYCEILKRLGYEVFYLYIEGVQKVPMEMHNYWGNHLLIFKKKLWIELFKRAFVLTRKKISGYNNVDDLYPIGLTDYVLNIQDKYKFDGIIVNYITLSKLFKANMQCSKILYTHDCMSYKKKHLCVKSFWFDLKPNQEAKGLQRCDTILSIQENESVYFRHLNPHSNVVTVYTYFKENNQPIVGNKSILFLSGKSILNVNGLNYFINEIFPLVLRQVPDAKLLIGGSICEVLPKIDFRNIEICGRYDDAYDFYEKGDIAINPIYQGTGLKIKTFEALSYGKTIIAHPHSAEGIYNSNEAPILLGKTPSEFANHIVYVLANVEIRKEYKEKALKYIRSLNDYVELQYSNLLKNR